MVVGQIMIFDADFIFFYVYFYFINTALTANLLFRCNLVQSSTCAAVFFNFIFGQTLKYLPSLRACWLLLVDTGWFV